VYDVRTGVVLCYLGRDGRGRDFAAANRSGYAEPGAGRQRHVTTTFTYSRLLAGTTR